MRIYLFLIFLFSLLVSCNPNNSKKQYAININKIDSINSLADNYQQYNIDTLIYILKANEFNSKEINYLKGLQKSLFQQGKLLYIKNNYNEAKSKFEEAKNISIILNDKISEANCIERIASITLATTESGLALKLYYQSLLIYEKYNNEKGKAKVYNILGIYQLGKRNFYLAEDYLMKSLKIHQHLKDTHNIIENMGNLGYVYECMNKYKKAEEIYSKLIEELKFNKDETSLAVIYYNYASLLQKTNNIEKAISTLQLSIKIAEENNDTSLLSTLYGNMGEIYLNKKNNKLSQKYLSKSCELANSIKDYETEFQALKFLVEATIENSMPNKIINSYNRAIILQDSIYQQKIRNNKHTIELNYLNEKNNEIIENQQKDIKIKKTQNLLLALIIIFITSITIISVFIYKKRQRFLNQEIELQNQKILNYELENKNKIIERENILLKHEKVVIEIKEKEKYLKNIALHFEYNSNILNIIAERINEIKNNNSNKINEEITKLDNEIKSMLKDSKNENLFNDYFNQLHSSFFENLKNNHPELSLNELKFCAYLMTHLSSNQIANILNVTNEAIRKSRYRIRKKLNLNQDESLEDYLSKFIIKQQ